MEVTVDTSQIQILEDFFNDLSNADQRKIFMAAYRKAAKPLVMAAKSTVPYRTRTLLRSIGTVEVPQEIAILVGAKKSGQYKGWHGHLVESGTVERFRKKSGGATGKMPVSHFFENAYNATEDQVFGTIEKSWYDEIDKFILKTNKRLK